MRLVSKNEQMLHVYFIAKKEKKKPVFLFYIYNFYFENLIYKWTSLITRALRVR